MCLTLWFIPASKFVNVPLEIGASTGGQLKSMLVLVVAGM
jgi:hypothetical protein